MMSHIAKHLGWLALLFLVASLERVVSVPVMYVVVVGWWVARFPAGPARVIAIGLAGVWMGAVYGISYTLAIVVLVGWWVGKQWFPTQASWYVLKLSGLLLLITAVQLVVVQPNHIWLTVAYVSGVVIGLISLSRLRVLWDQRLQLSAWWRYHQLGVRKGS